jgi:hypothetical protein
MYFDFLCSMFSDIIPSGLFIVCMIAFYTDLFSVEVVAHEYWRWFCREVPTII